MASPYEREIEELLKSLGELGPRETAWQRFRRVTGARLRGWARRIRDLPGTVPADQLMLAALLFVVAAFFLRFVLPGLARVVGVIGILMFLAAFAFSFQQLLGGSRYERRWRGRSMERSRGSPTPLDRFIFWLHRKLRGY